MKYTEDKEGSKSSQQLIEVGINRDLLQREINAGADNATWEEYQPSNFQDFRILQF